MILLVAAGVALVLLILRYSRDPAAGLLLSGRWGTRYRVFSLGDKLVITEPEIQDSISFQLFSKDDQREFLEQYGLYCQQGFDKKSSENLILNRFNELPEPFANELFKYCVLYTGVANVYWESSNLVPLVLWQDLLTAEDADNNIAMVIDEISEDEEKPPSGPMRLHHSFIRISKPKSQICTGMMRYLTEPIHAFDAAKLAETLASYVKFDGRNKKKDHKWDFYHAKCIDVNREVSQTVYKDEIAVHPITTPMPRVAAPCSMADDGFCCHVYMTSADKLPIMVARNQLVSAPKPKEHPLPYMFRDSDPEEMTDENLGMRKEEVPYVATIRAYPTGAKPATQFETPNFFDILMNNNCLPQDKDCFKCLKTGYAGEEGGDCNLCRSHCPCYCSALCQVRPPPKRLVSKWEVKRPLIRRDPSRLVPRIIHQTWYEPVTKEGYPNMSRLIESFRQSGWQYEFYNDDRAGQFISANFPPEVREAYDAIIPGAFKADLFRYCVLLIMGGIYADMDILLESNLDEIVHPSVGFMTPQDSPGETIGHRHCLWNGLMAVAPGHPFLAKTVENVVNNVRNRFTSVDYDDMLCPNPVLSVSHTVDTLFTAGPCILGASLNDVLKLHRQTSFNYGDIDLFQSEVNEGINTIDPEGDPRFLIEGRSIILKQNKQDMGAHRFTWDERNLVVSATDMPDYDDRPPSLEHYSKTHEKFGVYGLHKLYTNSKRANEEFTITVLP